MPGTALKLQRGAMIALFAALGWKTASKWKNAKMVEMIPQIKDVVPDTPLPNEADAKLLVDILAGVERGDAFEIEGEEGTAESAGGGTTATGDAKPKKKEKKVKEPKAKKEPKPKKEKKVKEPKIEGIRTKGRGYYAGNVIKRHGLEKGITEEMAQEVDALYGNVNTVVSRGALKWAFDVMAGFQAETLLLPEGFKYTPEATPASGGSSED